MQTTPKIFRVRQTFEAPRLDDPVAEVHAQLARLDLGRAIKPGQSVAVAVGSRGIANLAPIVRAVVEHLKRLGAEPFLVPSMGSHGGGTAEGQRRVLESYGLTEAFVGCPIRAGMETVVVDRAAEGFPIHFDRLAFEADHVLVCNRVKPHTLFVGDVESGLIKMMLIGLGNHAGATVYHRAIQDHSFGRIIHSVLGRLLERCHVLAGLAIVENAYDQTARIEALRPEEFQDREKRLLALAREWMPRLPFGLVDVLLIDQIGKDISGSGIDVNVVGRKNSDHVAIEGEYPRVRWIALRGLSPASHGNAIGMGIAEFCRTQLLRDVDPAITRTNVLAAGHVSAGMAPLDYPTDRAMLDTALSTNGLTDPADARLLWIADTLHLDEAECSTAYLDEASRRDDLEILTPPRPLPFDAEGNLPDVGDLAGGA